MDRDEILAKVNSVKQHVLSAGKITEDKMGSVYVLHGELSEKEMNSLYNHPKVKVHVTLTHGEGFGRPLLEACMSGKPIIASGWSGHLDFLNAEDAILVGGQLGKIHPSAVWDGVLERDSMWFMPDIQQSANALFYAWDNYKTIRARALKLSHENAKKFNFESIQKITEDILEKYIPKFATPVDLKLPSLSLPKIELPKIIKVGDTK